MNTPLPPWLETFRERLGASVIETHISWLLLADEEVWKFKKPLCLPFVDYGNAEVRRHCCEEELRLNRRLAPNLYLGIEAVAGDGGAAEWAVKMRRFPEAQRLDHVCARGELGFGHLGELAKTLSQFHLRAAVAGLSTAYGSPDLVAQQVLENFATLNAVLPTAAPQLAALETWTQRELQRIRPCIAARKASGKVRECHGDLHLGNLVLLNGQVTPFDCIEFNADLRWIDVASEIAFVYVDLLDHHEPALAAWWLDEWLSVSEDFDAVAVLRFYAVYRALVRAKVAALSGDAGAVSNYLNLAARLSAPPSPTLTITFGLSGSGKTTASAEWLRTNPFAGTLRLRSDVERKRLFGLKALQSSDSSLHGGIYTEEATQRTYQTMESGAARMLDAGWSVVVDAAFLRRAERDRFRELAASHGADFKILACSAATAELKQRLLNRRNDASEANIAVLERQMGWVEYLDTDELAQIVARA